MRPTPSISRQANKVAIVIPCYNEQNYLEETCASLGFGETNSTPENSILILVDNNSSDLTSKIAERIRYTSKENTVFITAEKIQGFIPARHRGNVFVKQIAMSNNWDISNVLILQADADTHYSNNYVIEMKKRADEVGSTILLESRTDYPDSFKRDYNDYINLCNRTDAKFEKIFPEELEDDNVVDDKATGYWLDDYFLWGGHKREYIRRNEEIFSETTRLYLRARTFGAKKVFVDAASAFHSTRKIFTNPLLHFATAGFPREKSWNNGLDRFPTLDIHQLCIERNNPIIIKALHHREEHLLAIFCILSLHVNRTLNREISQNMNEFSEFILPLIKPRGKSDLLNYPGKFLTDSFNLLEKSGEYIVNYATEFCAR